VEILEEKIPIRPETAEICRYFKIDPLQLVSSGTLLIAVKPKNADRVMENLRKARIEATIVGEFLEEPQNRTLVAKNGKTRALPKPASDQLWLALTKR
jgi:hydrogenase expression/formation protein HypE